ncbi:hypothetical protein [Paraburkholderia franconis]|nr:hypothetical protein [Paraburkholderia franconis]
MASLFNDLLVLADADRFNMIAISFRLSFTSAATMLAPWMTTKIENKS